MVNAGTKSHPPPLAEHVVQKILFIHTEMQYPPDCRLPTHIIVRSTVCAFQELSNDSLRIFRTSNAER